MAEPEVPALATEEAAAATEPEKTAGKRRLPMGVWIGITLAAQVAICFALLSFVVAPRLRSSAQAQNAPPVPQAEPKPSSGEARSTLIQLEPLVMNLAALEGEKTSFAKIGLAIELSGAKPPEGYEQKLPRIRDAVITAVSAKTVGEVSRPEGKEQLRSELETALSGILGSAATVRSVYFTNFVVQ